MSDCAYSAFANVRPMPEAVAALSYKVVFTKAEFAVLRQGLVPTNVNEKWVVLCEGLTLFFYRSRTGHCIYRLDLIHKGGKYHTLQALVNRDPNEYTQQNIDYDARMLHFIVRSNLLGERLLFPLMPSSATTPIRADAKEPELLSEAPDALPAARPWWKLWRIFSYNCRLTR